MQCQTVAASWKDHNFKLWNIPTVQNSHNYLFKKRDSSYETLHFATQNESKRPPEDLPEDRLQHIMPPNLSSFSATSPHLSLTIHFSNKHWDPSNDSPVWIRPAFIHLSRLNCSAGCMLFSKHKVWQYAMWCHYLTWLQHSVLKNAGKIDMKFQYTFFNLSNRESYRRYSSVKAALTAGVNVFREVTHVLPFFNVHWWGLFSPLDLPENTLCLT